MLAISVGPTRPHRTVSSAMAPYGDAKVIDLLALMRRTASVMDAFGVEREKWRPEAMELVRAVINVEQFGEDAYVCIDEMVRQRAKHATTYGWPALTSAQVAGLVWWVRREWRR